MTQSEVAKCLNISRVTYTNYELGNREPDFETLKKISVLFNTSTDRILSDSKVESTYIYTCKGDMRINDLPEELKTVIEDYTQLSAQGCEDLKNFLELLRVEENLDKKTE